MPPSLKELFAERKRLFVEFVEVKGQLGLIDQMIIDATKAEVDQMYNLSGKLSGAVRIEHHDGIIIKADKSKEVKWDSDKLLEIAKTMPWDAVKANFKIKFEVPERTYKALTPTVRALFDEARTVVYGEPKVTLEIKE